MEMTAAQRRVVEEVDGEMPIAVRVAGGAGSGRTTALVARYLHLVDAGHRPSTLLVVCHDRAAALRFRDAVLPRLSGGFDALAFTTWFGVAFDLVAREQGPVQLLSTVEQRAIVRRLLAKSESDWPAFGQYLGRETFAREVAGALVEFDVDRGSELGRFAQRYAAHLRDHHLVDRRMLLTTASELAASAPPRFAHVIVDDHDSGSAALDRLLGAVAGAANSAAVVSSGALPFPATEVTLDGSFRAPAAPTLLVCRHPSTEPEAVAGELLAARAEGVAWSSMAVLVRDQRRHGRSIARALSRHGIPVSAALTAANDDPAVTAIVDLLRWADGDEEAAGRLAISPLAVLGDDGLDALRRHIVAMAATATPAALAFAVWQRGLGHLVVAVAGVGGAAGDDASLDAVVAFLDGLGRRATNQPAERLTSFLADFDGGEVASDPWRTAAGAGEAAEAVTVTSVGAAAGREWHTVIVAGCVEGVWPRIRGRAPLFDPAPLSAAERRTASLADERRRFTTACSRATSLLIATAAPEAGVLLSRFVEDFQRPAPRPPAFRGPLPQSRPITTNPIAVFPDGKLVLSASQLSTYADCPLRYSFQYGLRVRDDAGAPAALGSLIHEVLAEFLRPDRDGARTHEVLRSIAIDRWSDDIARYRPQVEECRRDYFGILETWWLAEGGQVPGTEVLAVEHEFDIEVGDLRLVGAIDRIDRAADGSGIHIIDYKTGRKEPRPDALPDDLQLAIYHLAATRDPALVALGPPRQLTLLYLRSMKVFEQPIEVGHAVTTQARVLAVAELIRQERFEPSVEAACRNCSFHRLCPLQREGREVGQ